MPYAVIAMLLVRVVVWFINRNHPAEPQAPDPYGRNWNWLVTAWILLPLLAIVGFTVTAVGGFWGPLVVIVAVLGLFPWLTTRWVLIPWGWSKLAFWVVSRLSHGMWGYDRVSGGVVAGAWAALRSGSGDLEWLEERLPGHEATVTPGAALGAGLIAAARGDLPGARLLIAGVELFEPAITFRLPRRLAREWLVVDAAATGDWARVEVLAVGGPRSATIGLLGAMAQRRLHRAEAPGNPGLWAWWALAPGKRRTIDVVQAVADAPIAAPWRPAPGPMPVEPDALARALALHATLLGRERPRREEVVAVAEAWDRALGDAALAARLEGRAAEIGARQVASARARLADEVQQDLVALARAAEVPLADLPGATVSGAARRIREDVLAELEGLGTALARRVEARRGLPPVDELREWLAIRDAWDRGTRQAGPEVRRLAFRSVHDPVCSLAVWLFNDRGQRALGNALFRWLLREAEAVGDSRAIELQTKNVRCGY